MNFHNFKKRLIKKNTQKIEKNIKLKGRKQKMYTKMAIFIDVLLAEGIIYFKEMKENWKDFKIEFLFSNKS